MKVNETYFGTTGKQNEKNDIKKKEQRRITEFFNKRKIE